jgi:tetratricopeptide (TPR) repeat protein
MDNYREIPLETIHPNPFIARLLKEPDIFDALGKRRFHRAYELFLQRRAKAQSKEERDAIDGVLSNRRSFLEPLNGAPGMFTFNGIGTRLYGNAEYDPRDGTSIGTLYFVLLFLPVFPLAEYLVRPASSGGWRAAYTFFGRVPTSRMHRLWRWLALAGSAAAIVLTIAVSAIGSWVSSRGSTVHVVNDLDIAVNARVGTQTFALAPHAETSDRIAKGSYHVVVTNTAGAVLEEQDIDVPGGVDVVVYDVLGASPLYLDDVVYSQYSSPTATQPAPELFTGNRFVTRDGVDYVFVDPPKSLTLDSRGSDVTKRHFGRVPGGWQVAVTAGLASGKRAEAIDVAERVALAQPDYVHALELAASLMMMSAGDAARLLALSEKLVAAHPDEVEPHRYRQTALELLGRSDECLAIYRKMRDERPDSSLAGYLDARVEPLDLAVPLYASLAARFPDDAYIARGYGYVLFVTARYADAIDPYVRAEKLDPSRASWIVSEHARSLVATGHADEARTLVANVATAAGKDLDIQVALLYARLARLDGRVRDGDTADRFLTAMYDHEPVPLDARVAFEMRAFDFTRAENAPPPQLKEATMRAAYDITLAAMTRPARAIELAAAADKPVLNQLPTQTIVLLAAEMARLGDAGSAKKLLDVTATTVHGYAALVASIQAGAGAPAALPDVVELDPELRAAIFAVRARAQPAGKARDALNERARAEDILRGVAYTATTAWPAP